eukprot:scaffold43313_cov52-Phaeocystis_antarctica.AAC.1
MVSSAAALSFVSLARRSFMSSSSVAWTFVSLARRSSVSLSLTSSSALSSEHPQVIGSCGGGGGGKGGWQTQKNQSLQTQLEAQSPSVVHLDVERGSGEGGEGGGGGGGGGGGEEAATSGAYEAVLASKNSAGLCARSPAGRKVPSCPVKSQRCGNFELLVSGHHGPAIQKGHVYYSAR